MRAQESVSLMIVIGLVLVILLLFTNIISQDINTANNIKFIVNVMGAGDYLAKTINNVWLAGPGATQIIQLKEADDDYYLLVRSNNVIAVHKLGTNSFSTFAPLVINANITSGEVTVTNNGGVIIVSQ